MTQPHVALFAHDAGLETHANATPPPASNGPPSKTPPSTSGAVAYSVSVQIWPAEHSPSPHGIPPSMPHALEQVHCWVARSHDGSHAHPAAHQHDGGAPRHVGAQGGTGGQTHSPPRQVKGTFAEHPGHTLGPDTPSTHAPPPDPESREDEPPPGAPDPPPEEVDSPGSPATAPPHAASAKPKNARIMRTRTPKR
jgi:hypothetical protein